MDRTMQFGVEELRVMQNALLEAISLYEDQQARDIEHTCSWNELEHQRTTSVTIETRIKAEIEAANAEHAAMLRMRLAQREARRAA